MFSDRLYVFPDGDLTISQERLDAPVFTALYILVGVLVVFQYAGELYDYVFHT